MHTCRSQASPSLLASSKQYWHTSPPAEYFKGPAMKRTPLTSGTGYDGFKHCSQNQYSQHRHRRTAGWSQSGVKHTRPLFRSSAVAATSVAIHVLQTWLEDIDRTAKLPNTLAIGIHGRMGSSLPPGSGCNVQRTSEFFLVETYAGTPTPRFS